jgi:phosphinothricin acetyltransferase
VKLRLASPDDAAAIADIYAPYVLDCAISFELEPPDAAVIAQRIAGCGDLYPWLVATDEQGDVAGYAYATEFRARRAYRYCVETSVYVERGRKERGIGRLLYERLLETLCAQGFTQAIAAIALPNEPSIRFHERLGFRHTGTYSQVGWKCDEWHDVGLWQRGLAEVVFPVAEPKRLSEVPAQP